MNVTCEVVKDLLPLYHDGVCSGNSRALVEEHLSECTNCKKEMEKLNNDTLDRRVREERDTVVGHHAQAVRKKSLVTGTTVAAVMTVPILVCLIVNLATGHALDWFFIVLTAIMTLSSFTVVPLIMERHRWLWTLGSFTATLTLMLFTICSYVGGDWFFIAETAVLLGLSVFFGPLVAYALPITGFAAGNKGLLAMAADTFFLYLLIFVVGVQTGGASFWRPALLITTFCGAFVWVLFLVIRYGKGNGFIRAGLCTIISGLFMGVVNDVVDWILGDFQQLTITKVNFLFWNPDTVEANTALFFLLAGVIAGGILLLTGLRCKKENKGDGQN